MQGGAPLLRIVSGVTTAVSGVGPSTWSAGICPVDGWGASSLLAQSPRGGSTTATGAVGVAAAGGAARSRAAPSPRAPPSADAEPTSAGDAQLQTDGEEAAWTPETWAWDPYAMVRRTTTPRGAPHALFAILRVTNPCPALCAACAAARGVRTRAAARADARCVSAPRCQLAARLAPEAVKEGPLAPTPAAVAVSLRLVPDGDDDAASDDAAAHVASRRACGVPMGQRHARVCQVRGARGAPAARRCFAADKALSCPNPRFQSRRG
jgi:hypothetical protein